MLSQKDLFKSAVLNAVNQFKIENKIDCPEIDEKLVRVENPPRLEMGDLGSPMFPFAKMFRMAPPAIAASVAQSLKKSAENDASLASLGEFDAAGPYVNIKLNKAASASGILASIVSQGENYGSFDSAGKKPLEGDWLNVLTSDGTRGWCFSYNLRLFETDRLGQKITNGAETSEEENTSSEIDTLLEGVWYPDSYKAMIDSGRIDTDKLIPSYNFHLDTETKKLSFTMPKIREEWEYTGAVQTSANQYNLNDIPIVVTVRRSNFIVVRYTGESGKPEDFNLVAISENIDELVQAERERREKELEQITMFAPYFQSKSYGQLRLNTDHSFVWSNNRLLVPAVISSSARNTGTVRIKYFLSKSLSASYDGVLTFKFDGMEKEVNFLYKMESSGLRFEDATGAVIKNNILMERALSPLVLFFSKGE